MKTIDKKFFRPAAILSAAFLWLSFLSLPAATGTQKEPQQHFFIGLAAGFYYPQQDTFREIYSNALWPVELQLELALGRKISFFGAARYLETSGNTVLLFARQPDEAYALHWRMTTLRLGLHYRFSPSRFTPFVGAGGSYSFYREQWPEASLTYEGQKAGFFCQVGGCYRLQRRWQSLVQLEYSAVPAGSGPQGKVSLGGFSLLLGLMAGIF
jgi:hypothetical protein